MECRQCGYALWNLTEPRCPECGAGFDLRQYRFRPARVAFACPHCGSLHGGTGDQYVPTLSDEATCRACGEVMAVPSMPVVPLTVDASAVPAHAMAWDERERLGFWRAWWKTLVLVLTRPTELAQRTAPGSSFVASYHFAIIGLLIAAVVQAVTVGGLLFPMMMLLGLGSGGGALALFIIVGGFVAVAVTIPLLATAFIAAPAHLALCLLEPNRDRRFLVTARLVNYSFAPATFTALPLVGLYCGQAFYIWVLVSAIIMLRVAHHTHGGKAALAVLWMPALMGIAYVGVIVGGEMFGLFGP